MDSPSTFMSGIADHLTEIAAKTQNRIGVCQTSPVMHVL